MYKRPGDRHSVRLDTAYSVSRCCFRARGKIPRYNMDRHNSTFQSLFNDSQVLAVHSGEK